MCSHVDDLLSAFVKTQEGDPLGQQVMQKLNIGERALASEGDGFVYTGRRFKQLPDGSVRIAMEDYVDGVIPARVSRERRKQQQQPLDSRETTIFRSLIRQLAWASRCLFPEMSLAVSELSGHLTEGKVEHLLKANTLLRRLKQPRDRPFSFSPKLDIM